VFQDEHGDYPEGTYLRNPAGSKHMPFSRLGCTIFVKLGRFMKDDTAQKNLQTSQQKWLPQKTNPGIKEMLLHSHQGEKTLFIKVSPNTEFEWCHKGKGEEILIINGELHEGQHIYPKGTWLRFGEGGLRKRYTKSNETILFMKTGHLVR
jgi:anti-sigma factor ChrR (cupin superfamily)